VSGSFAGLNSVACPGRHRSRASESNIKDRNAGSEPAPRVGAGAGKLKELLVRATEQCFERDCDYH
jgi:hypothetical protein